MYLKQFINERERLKMQAKEILEKAELEARNLTDEEKDTINGIKTKISKLDKSIERRIADGEDEPVEKPVNAGDMPYNAGYKAPTYNKAISKTYRGMFYGNDNIALGNGGFKSFDEFLSIIHSGRADNRLILASMTEGSPSLGGFSVPEEYGAFLIDKSIENEIIRPKATVWAMHSDTRKVPAFDGANHTDGLLGGISGDWLAEGQTATRKNVKLRLLTLSAKKLACFSQASNELLADGMKFEEMLTMALAKGMGWYMDYAFINGTGAGQPLGIINDPALITVPKDKEQADGTITYNNVVNMFSRLAPSCFGNAVWLANPSVIPQLLTMIITIGTGGAQIPVFKEENGRFTLLGKEIIFTEKCPALGNKGDLILADLSQYAIGMRKEISIDRSNAPGWMEDMTDYRVIIRVDGQGTWDKPITPKNGNTLSWCVALENR